jgi:nucleoside-diphosphate-sugar epimerase
MYSGTANVIQACVEHNVPRLIYTSSVDVVIGFDDIINGEESLPVPKRFLFHGYPDTKHRAESLVAEANGRALAAGKIHWLSNVTT